jgi:tetratricopeptide (TPR) repeat protein
MKTLLLPLVAFLTLAWSHPTWAIFIRADLEKVPVERLIANLEKAAAAEPMKVETALNLARTHAMAYAKKADELEVNKRTPTVPWMGYSPPQIPFAAVVKTDDAAKKEAAAKHLADAIKWYETALKLDADNYAVRIGLAWATEQSGKKDEAIKLYRKLIEDAWDKKEKDLKALGLSGQTIMTEAGGYLIALLDAEKDKAEIATLKERIAKLKALPRPVTPIAVPLKAGLNAADIEDQKAEVAFDADGTGEKKKWSWIRPNAAWLVYDPASSGQVGSALQLFGSVTFRLAWSNGYGALAALDDDGDGELRGRELAGLALWHDANGNGSVERGEVNPLKDYEIVALSCRWEASRTHPEKITFSPKGVTYKDGSTRPTYDLILRSK